MVRYSTVPLEHLDQILGWLNPDREAAALIYVQLCHDLTKIFAWNHCHDPEALTDEVIDRVARKVHEVLPTYEGDPRLFFYGIARNLIRENLKRAKTQVSLEAIDLPLAPDIQSEEETAIMREECLQSCLQQLTAEKRDLILAYYAKEKQSTNQNRSQLADRLGISSQSLRVRAHRIRTTLEDCIEACLDQKVNT